MRGGAVRGEIIIEEQGLRDGLQSEGRVLTTTEKLQLLDALLDAGLKRVQLCSFVHPRRVPQMADAEALFKRLERRPGVTYSALVLNLRGVERAAAVGVEHLAISLSASDTHSRKNSGKGLAEAREAFLRAEREVADYVFSNFYSNFWLIFGEL